MNDKKLLDKALLNKLGARVVQVREEKGMTQQQLADAIGAKLKWVQRLEAGEINAELYSIIMIVKAFDMPMKEFFTADF